MNKTLAKIISVAFHPAILQLLGYVLIWIFYTDYHRISIVGIRYVASAVLLFTWGLPLVMYILLKVTGRIKSLTLNEQSERNLPYLVTAFCYLACWRLFYNSHIPGIIAPYTLASGMVVMFCGIANYFSKVSAHTAGCGGLIAFIIFSSFKGEADVRVILVATLLVTGLVFTARKALDAHSNGQLVIGFIGGIISAASTLIISVMIL